METQHLMEFLEGHFARLESRINDLITRREYEVQQKDIDRAHEKYREFETRLRAVETGVAGDRGESKGRFTMTEKILGAVLTIIVAAAIVGLGLK